MAEGAAMKPVRVTRYRCDHCPRTFSNRDSAFGHERRCFFNPAREPFEDEIYPWVDRRGRFIWPREGEDELGPSAGWEPDGGSDSDDYLDTFVYLDGEWRPIPQDIAAQARALGHGYNIRRFALWRGVAVFLGESVSEPWADESAAEEVITGRPATRFCPELKLGEVPF